MFDPAEELGNALYPTRMIRLGLEAMWSAVDGLPDSVALDPGLRPALVTITDWLEKTEDGALRDALLVRNYVVIRPVSLVNPPSAGSMADITAAIGVLNGHALIISDDLARGYRMSTDDELAGQPARKKRGLHRAGSRGHVIAT